MNHAEPIFDRTTHYRIEIRGRIDAEWLRSLGEAAEISVDKARESNDVTVLEVNTDQAGIVGLVRKLHGMGIPIQQLQVIQSL